VTVAKLQVWPVGSRLSQDSADNSQLANFLNLQSEKMLSREVLALALTEQVPEDELPGMKGKKIRELQTFKESETAPLSTLQGFARSLGRQKR